MIYFVFFFFFSSRRRHTRCLSDWSSDVCSSDLVAVVVGVVVGMAALSRPVLAAFHVAAVVIQVAVVAGGCLVGTGVLAAAAVPTVRLWRWALAHWPERAPAVRVAVCTAQVQPEVQRPALRAV